jgi:hypothetical protein
MRTATHRVRAQKFLTVSCVAKRLRSVGPSCPKRGRNVSEFQAILACPSIPRKEFQFAITRLLLLTSFAFLLFPP